MINFSFKLDSGEEHVVTATSRDVLNWEKTTQGAMFGNLMDNLRMTDLHKIAWFAAKRAGQFSGTEQEFNEQVDLTFKGLAAQLDPTKQALSTTQ